MTSVTVLAKTVWSRPCAKCGAPITLARTQATFAWMAFEPDPRPLRTYVNEGGALCQDWSMQDRHQCSGPLFPSPVAQRDA